RYLNDFDWLPNENLDRTNHVRERAGDAARRGQALFDARRTGFDGQSCASCHPRSSFFRDGRVHRIGSARSPSPDAPDGGSEPPTFVGLAETAPYFHDGRFATLEAVVDFFDQNYALALSSAERADLTAYLAAVGAVDRPSDERPFARQLDDVFAYASLL